MRDMDETYARDELHYLIKLLPPPWVSRMPPLAHKYGLCPYLASFVPAWIVQHLPIDDLYIWKSKASLAGQM